MQVQPYLFFEGRCEEALEYYQKSLGAEVKALMRYRESPDPMPAGMLPPGSQDKVMHCDFSIGESHLMASDGGCSGRPGFSGVALTLSVADAAEAARLFDALADGGQVRTPLGKTFFSPAFGMASDRFGVSWIVLTLPAPGST